MHASLINLLNIQLNELNIFSPASFDPENLQSYGYDVDVEFDFDFEENLVFMNFDINASTVSLAVAGSDEEDEDASVAAGFMLIFRVDELRSFVVDDGEGYAPGPWLGPSLAGIAHSTVRGMLTMYLQHTALRNFILPVMDPKELLQEEL